MTTEQYHLNKLISEEILAFEIYKIIQTNLIGTDRRVKAIRKSLEEIANDEYEDHALKMIDYAVKNNLPFPFDNTDYLKYAGNTVKEVFKSIPHTSDPLILTSLITTLEQDAIESYNASIMAAENDPDFSEKLYSIIVHNLKDEVEHFDTMQVALASLLQDIMPLSTDK